MFAAGSSSLVSVHREQTRPNTKHATPQHTASRNAGKLRGDRHCCCCSGSNQPASAPSDLQNRSGSTLIHSLQPGGQAGSSVAPSLQPCPQGPTWNWPGTSPGCCGQTAGWLSSSPCPPCCPFLISPFRCAAARERHLREVRRCRDRMLPSKTVGNIVTT